MDVHAFVLAHLPQLPARILEVGCGNGELASALARAGYDVTAIDPEAPSAPIFRRVSLEDFSETDSFDAVVASRSLHHIENLEAAADKLHALLVPSGLLIINEFVWDRMDEATARWYLSNVDEPGSKHDALKPGNFPAAWVAEHKGLHPFAPMREALDERFELKTFEWVPYIAQYYLEAEDLIAHEQELIASGKIQALGFRYVASPSVG